MKNKLMYVLGKPCNFSVTVPDVLYEIKPNGAKLKKYVSSDKVSVVVQSAPEMSVHEVNTDVIQPTQRGMLHLEGGWPKDIDPNEPDHLNMFRKKVSSFLCTLFFFFFLRLKEMKTFYFNSRI
jgi:dynein intermediate chain 2